MACDTLFFRMFGFESAADLDALIAKCRRGDHRAWATLVERFQRLVYSVPKRIGLSEEDCADVFQTTFLALHRYLDRIEQSSTVPKWLTVTASRESFRIKRSYAKAPISFEQNEGTLEDVLAVEEAQIDEQVVLASNADTVQQAILDLQEKCRDLLTALYIEEDVSYQEISDRLGIAVGSIGPTRARCIEKLRSMLKRVGFFENDVSTAMEAASSGVNRHGNA